MHEHPIFYTHAEWNLLDEMPYPYISLWLKEFVRFGNLSTCLKSCDVMVYRLAPLSMPSGLTYFVTTIWSYRCSLVCACLLLFLCLVSFIGSQEQVLGDKIHESIPPPIYRWMDYMCKFGRLHNSFIASGGRDNWVGRPVLLVSPWELFIICTMNVYVF